MGDIAAFAKYEYFVVTGKSWRSLSQDEDFNSSLTL